MVACYDPDGTYEGKTIAAINLAKGRPGTVEAQAETVLDRSRRQAERNGLPDHGPRGARGHGRRPRNVRPRARPGSSNL